MRNECILNVVVIKCESMVGNQSLHIIVENSIKNIFIVIIDPCTGCFGDKVMGTVTKFG